MLFLPFHGKGRTLVFFVKFSFRISFLHVNFSTFHFHFWLLRFFSYPYQNETCVIKKPVQKHFSAENRKCNYFEDIFNDKYCLFKKQTTETLNTNSKFAWIKKKHIKVYFYFFQICISYKNKLNII